MISQVDKQLQVTWMDNHVSKFDISWLVERSFTDENKKRYLENHYQPELQLWSKKKFEMKTFQASDVFQSDEGIFTRMNSAYLFPFESIFKCDPYVNRSTD